jgi:hypothetical protein
MAAPVDRRDRPGPAPSGVAQQGVRGGLEVARHLHREHAVRAQPVEQSRQQHRVIIEPLQRRVGVDQIERVIWRPCGDIGLDPRRPHAARPCLRQHLQRTVDPDDRRLGPALRQQCGRIAGPAAEIGDARRVRQGHPRQQIARRPRALVGEGQIALRLPGQSGHLPVTFARRGQPLPDFFRHERQHGEGINEERAARQAGLATTPASG